MGFILDSLLKKTLFMNETINSNFISEPVYVAGVEQSYFVQLDFVDGDGNIEAEVALEASIDGINYVPYDQATISLTDDDGTFVWDVAGSGAVYIRLNFAVTAGQFTATCRFSGKRRH